MLKLLARVCLLTSLALVLGALAVLAGAPAAIGDTTDPDPGDETVVDQEVLDPGGDYVYEESGECAGSWATTDGTELAESNVSCVHADAGVEGGGLIDDLSPYDSDYVAELGANPAYCSSGGNRISVIYATTNDGPDRYAALKPTLKDRSERADYFLFKSAKLTNGNRHFRFVCTSGSITITKAVLANTADDTYDLTIERLRASGFNDPTRKYLVFADWKEPGQVGNSICGRANVFSDDRAAQTNDNNKGNMHAVVYLKASFCTEQYAQSALHELGHSLGGVQQSAPHYDDDNKWHPSDEYDVMAYGASTTVVCDTFFKNSRYDCNDNDYFDTHPSLTEYLSSHWNIADNKFLVNS